jgi:hypothetical protein
MDKRDGNWFMEVQQMLEEAQAGLEEAEITAIRAMDAWEVVFLDGLHTEVPDP